MNIAGEKFFGALSHPLRLRALVLLQFEGELCVCDLTRALNVAQPVMSRQLGILREAGITLARREGLWIHYRVNPGLPPWALQVIEETAQGVVKQKPYRGDRASVRDTSRQACGDRCA